MKSLPNEQNNFLASNLIWPTEYCFVQECPLYRKYVVALQSITCEITVLNPFPLLLFPI